MPALSFPLVGPLGGSQVSTENNITKLLRALVGPFQKLEDTIQTLLVQRNVNLAIGVQLDQLGKLVGEPRDGVTDDEVYRRYVRARIAVNKSDGQPETIYRIARLVLGVTTHTLEIENQGNASYLLRVAGGVLAWPVAELLVSYVSQATSAGVRVTVEFSLIDDTLLFAFDGGTGLGFGDTNNSAIGGALASVI